MNFINKLKQTFSFNILSISGYLFLAFWLESFFFIIPEAMRNSIDTEFGGLDTIFAVLVISTYYYIFCIILGTIGIIEYIIRNKKFKFKDKKTSLYNYIFVIGLLLIFSPAYIVIYVEIYTRLRDLWS